MALQKIIDHNPARTHCFGAEVLPAIEKRLCIAMIDTPDI